jgi:hypothetical protein
MRLFSHFVLAVAVLFLLCNVTSSHAASPYKVFKTRPRLYVTAEKISSLRKVIKGEPYSSWLNNIKLRSKGLIGGRTPSTLIRYTSNTLRRPADSLVNQAFYYLMTEDPTVLSNIEHLLELFVKSPNWASDNDIGAAHSLFALSVTYDWLYDKLPSSLKKSVQASILKHAGIFYDLIRTNGIWWTRSPLQNHNYVNTAALAVAGIALYGETPRASKWLDAAKDNFDNVISLLSTDGASHEGVSYWSYGTLWLLNYYMAVSPALGLDKVESSDFFKNTSIYRLYSSLPGFKYNLDYADSAIVDYKGPGAILRCLASIFRDGRAQWLAAKIEEERNGRPALWQDIIWYDSSVKSVSPEDLPLFKWFDNLGFLITRSSWKDDAEMCFYKAGPPQGFLAQSKKVYAGSHIHPDAGSYSLWLGREPIVQDDGYVKGKLSSSHNLLTFGDLGQSGEGGEWFRVQPLKDDKIYLNAPKVVLNKRFQIISTDFASLYPALAGVRSWNRVFVVIDGRVVVVRDIARTKSDTDILSLLHLTRKARKYANSICLDFSSDLVMNTKSSAGTEIDFKRYLVLTIPMGRKIPKSGMLLSLKAPHSRAAQFISAIAESADGCVDSNILKSYDADKDYAVVEDKYGRYGIDFKAMKVSFEQENH